MSYSTDAQREFCTRLGDDWIDLVTCLGVPPYEQRRFRTGYEPLDTWHWLEQRKRLDDLPTALLAISRGDLADVLYQGSLGDHRGNSVDPAVALVMEDLAKEVRREWQQEAIHRQVVQPVPLRVRWSSTGRAVAASRQMVVSDGSAADWHTLPLHGNVDEIAERFVELPRKQLVVLGEPGAGKSVLAILLTLQLIERRRVGAAVPVLLQVASWNPVEEAIEAFLLRRLREEFTFLGRSVADGRTMADALLSQGGILPIIDGLDEVPSGCHAAAVQALDSFAADDRALVVTCRSREYEQAVVGSGVVISRAAVVEIEPVDVEQAIEFLTNPAPGLPRWQPVFDRLRQEPDGPLAAVLSTPLMVSLARSAYRPAHTEPSRLLQLADRTALADSLIDTFVASVYIPEQVAPQVRGRSVRTYDPVSARRWLSCLAYQLFRVGSRDFWWWQLKPGLLSIHPGRVNRWLSALPAIAATVLVGLVVGLVSGVADGGLAAFAAAAVIAINATRAFRSMWPNGFPPYLPSKYRSRRWRRHGGVRISFAFGIVYGVVVGILVHDLVLGGIGGLACGGLTAALVGWRVPSRIRRSSPIATVWENRRLAIMAAAQFAGIAATAFGGLEFGWLRLAVTWNLDVPDLDSPLAQFRSVAVVAGTAAAVYGTAAALRAGLSTWISFRVAHGYLALNGRLPWRLWAFLEDAYKRGTIRQAGTAWQFRHALLHDRLASQTHKDHLFKQAEAGDEIAKQRVERLLRDEINESNRLTSSALYEHVTVRAAAERLSYLLATRDKLAHLRAQASHGDALAAALSKDVQIELARTAKPWDLHAVDARGDAVSLILEGRSDDAVRVLQDRAAAGDRTAAEWAASLMVVRGTVEEAIVVWRVRADAGDDVALSWLTYLHLLQGRTDDAAAVWRPSADTDRYADAQMIALRNLDRRVGQLRAGAAAGDQGDAARLAALLIAFGRVDDVLELWPSIADPDESTTKAFVHLLETRNRVDSAIAVRLRDAADPVIGQALAELLVKHGRLVQLRERADAGDRPAVIALAQLLEDYGQVTELGVRADAGDLDMAARLAHVLAKTGDVEALRARAKEGDMAAAWRLAEVLAVNGHVEELRALADADDAAAVRRLADLYADSGAVEELRERASRGDLACARRLADLLAAEGSVEELQAMSDAGDIYARRQLEVALATQVREESLRASSEAADLRASEWLAATQSAIGATDVGDAAVRAPRQWQDAEAARLKAEEMAALGDFSGAITLCQARVSAGDRSAKRWLAALIAQRPGSQVVDSSFPQELNRQLRRRG
ncbi:hypothetical protein [Dactylosporangium sp. CA-139066]|uniref:hypothetical protein n=1 Tax=Dactylosporangium sp. CA-139066 TaxID=3239930 RepID=UPI003D8CC060